MVYENIVFMQDSNADEFFELLERDGEKRALDFLKQWDYGDSPIGISIGCAPWGKADRTFKKGSYVMSYNTGLGYAGLVKILE